MKLTFWGAAQTVTGSMHHLAVDGRQFLLDCGMRQGRRKEADSVNRNLPFEAEGIDGVILSHAHIDHSGNLPTLVNRGFRGPIYATPPTAALCDDMLRDSAYIQEKDAEFVNRKRQRRRSDDLVEPLFRLADVETTLPLFRHLRYHRKQEIAEGLTCELFDAGHLLGSAAVLLTHGSRKIIFSGDVGRKNLPVIKDPEQLPPADYLILESTYGNRFHKQDENVSDKLCGVIKRTAARGGKVIVPAFAVGRTQALVLLLHELANSGCIPKIPLFVDSPLAVDVTEVFRNHPDCFDAETMEYVNNGLAPFDFSSLTYIRKVEDSMKLNDLRGPFVVLSASGMCEAGRILHHLRHNIEDPRNTVLITGFQADGTLGRKLVDRWGEVNIFGEPRRVRAEIVTMNELSGHADQGELVDWMAPISPRLRRVFLVHGEPSQAAALANAIWARYRIPVETPARGESFRLA
ncbi:MAG: MBL fold metallo-hydrolase [Bryobacterales bacterium]|nr:MBL fold metallo-hydrolase [Bryobacterales bacterium]